jgi:hypothetical protein
MRTWIFEGGRMDFYKICTKELKNGMVEVFPDFRVGRSKDLMVRGKSFYAIWDEETGLWSTDEYDVQRLVDRDLRDYAESKGESHVVKELRSFNTNGWTQFRKFISNISDNSHQLDEHLTFSNTKVAKGDYISRRLSYALAQGDISAWDELVGTLYFEDERQKIEWAIGAVVSGDSTKLQKFMVFYGPAGTGKSTILNVIQKLFSGYVTTFEAKALGNQNASFATEVFKSNPLVAIQHDGDLSKIEDNTKLNSIISHEEMTMNEKYKPSYTSRVNAFLFMGTNQPVKISDAKSGIIRRLIDVHPSGKRIPINHYNTLMSQIDFELGAIAQHCLDVYHSLGKNYYNAYRPLEMMLQTDIFFNFIEANYDVFKGQDHVSLKQAYMLYKEYCSDTGIERPLPQYKVREELRNYFEDFKERVTIDGLIVRSVYSGFTANKFKVVDKKDQTFSLVLEETTSILDRILEDQPAQYANAKELPSHRWENVKTTLSELDTSKLHYVKVPLEHIVIDFDLKDENGQKSLEQNLRVASEWPATYGEYSKSGGGIHLHYLYAGDVHTLAREYSPGLEIKVFVGDSALRRRFTRCNNVPIATLTGGLPLKERKMLTKNTIQSERGLRELIERNLKKEIHPGTKPSIDFIHKILDEVNESGLEYDVTDLRGRIISFANNSSNHPFEALKVVQKMKFHSNSESSSDLALAPKVEQDERLVIFDVEVYPNLFVVCWKYENSDNVVRMINPTGPEVEPLLNMKLVGFNNRRYDNHILYARFLGYDNAALYALSQKIIEGNVGAMFGSAYDLSYADIYEFSSKKQSLKKFQVELGLTHKELSFPWDEPVPEEFWERVVEYCVNDVLSTEAVLHDRHQDLVARNILADLSGLSVNDTTQKHTAQIIFKGDRRAQSQFVYTDLSKEFPGYVFERGKSLYRGEDPKEGGYVHAEPGIYKNVALLDIASMHPTTIEVLNLFGPYTKNFSELKQARIAIKRKNYTKAKTLLDGKLAKYLGSEEDSDALSYALKIVINIVYGLTSARFDNAFRDVRNVDNIVAKRGALFMLDLKHAVQEQGFVVAHIKTDSIKIPDATPEIIDFVKEFGARYGYEFELEKIYDKLCLVNDAVYVAAEGGKWTAVGAQFQHPYVYKTLFSHELTTFDDLCEVKQVSKGAIYIDLEYDRPMVLVSGKTDGMHFVGRTGRFVPVLSNGGILYRVHEGKHYAIAGTKGYFWMEAELFLDQENQGKFSEIDMSYFDNLVHDAIKTINKFGDFEELVK